MNIPRLIIAGTHSGVGKTTITLAVMAALSRRGLTVQPFKVGPDYLDPLHHARVTGRVSRNLDGWMLSRDYTLKSFAGACADADIAVIEGVMGLFDGKETTSDEASTAQMAKWLSAPVVLVVDAGGMARSLGALIQGFSQFDPDLSLAGVIFNRVSGKAHLDWLRELARLYLKPFGGLPREPDIEIPERHLGLVHPDQAGVPNRAIDRLVQEVESHLDMDGLLRLADSAPPLDAEQSELEHGPRRCRIALARDEAFHFYYPDNLELLERAGAELIEFSPIHDSGLPEEIHGVYLGGGYPELYARELSANHTMQAAIRRFAESDGPVYAECGGMMYLAHEIRTVSGERFAMAGIIPGCIQMKERLSRLGYVEVIAREENPVLRSGEKARGHEFHYSDWDEEPSKENGLKRVYHVCKSGREEIEGYLFRNVLASYIHLHFGSNPDMARRFVEQCEGFRRRQ